MNRGTIQAMSFVSGLALTAVVLGVTLSKNQALRTEVESQVNSVLKTTRSLVNMYKNIVSKSKAAASLIKNENDSLGQGATPTEQGAKADNQWDAVEMSLN